MTMAEFDEHVADFILLLYKGTYDERNKRRVRLRSLARLRSRLWLGSQTKDIDITEIRPLNEWYAWILSWETGTQFKLSELCEVKKFYRYLEDRGVIRWNPTARFKGPKHIRLPPKREITLAQYTTLRDAFTYPHGRWYVILAWHTGLSFKDCCFLKWSQVSFYDMMITQPRAKTGRYARIPILHGSELHRELLARWKYREVTMASPGYVRDLDMETYVEPVRKGRGDHHANDHFNRLAKRLFPEIQLSFHCFRVSFCSRLANSNVNPSVAMSMTGHKDLVSFSRYIRPDDESLHASLHLAMERAARQAEPPAPDENVIPISGRIPESEILGAEGGL